MDLTKEHAGEEIEITPAMIEAGAAELTGFDWIEGDEQDAARRVYVAMSAIQRVKAALPDASG